MSGYWSGRTVAITGATGGVGDALARELSGRGARLVLTGRRADRLRALAEELGAEHVVADLGDADGRAEILDAIVAHGVDTLVHNAGVQFSLDFAEGDPEELAVHASTEIEVDLTAPISLTAHAIGPLAAASRALGRPGAIVFVTSGLALAPKRDAPVYCAAKAGLRQFARALGYQLEDAKLPLTSHEILLPLVDTAMTAGRDAAKMRPEDVAVALAAGVERGRAEVYIGKTRVLRILMRLSPWLGRRILRG